jgi:hypothetical protein
LGKDLPGMQKLKTSSSSYSQIRLSRFYSKIRRDEEGNYILIKGTIQQDDKTILNIYALNIGVPTFIKHF